MQMSAINYSSCAASCAPGYYGEVEKIVCTPDTSSTGGQYETDGSCQETMCAKFQFDPDMEELSEDSPHKYQSCVRGVALQSQTERTQLFRFFFFQFSFYITKYVHSYHDFNLNI